MPPQLWSPVATTRSSTLLLLLPRLPSLAPSLRSLLAFAFAFALALGLDVRPMLALQCLRSKSIECRTVPQHHTPTIAPPTHPLPLLRVSLGGSWWENVCAQQAVPCSRLRCVESSVDWQEGWLPSPLLRCLHSPPPPQRQHRCQAPHLRAVLHNPPATQRRSARPHAHHCLSSTQPPPGPPRGGDVIIRAIHSASLLPRLLLYFTSSASSASSTSSSSSTSLHRSSPPVRYHQYPSQTVSP